MNIPIVRLEIEGMRQEIAVAFTQFQIKQDEMVQEALRLCLRPENVKAIIIEAVSEELQTAIEQEAKDFFRFGEGRELVKKLVIAKLKEETKP